MSFVEGDLIRVSGKSGTFRVRGVKGEEVTCFGGPHYQWRTFMADTLRKATKREATTFLRTEQIIKAALPKAPVKVKGRR